jgi:hypothetical protein
LKTLLIGMSFLGHIQLLPLLGLACSWCFFAVFSQAKKLMLSSRQITVLNCHRQVIGDDSPRSWSADPAALSGVTSLGAPAHDVCCRGLIFSLLR